MTHLMWYPGHDLLLSDIVRAENCALYDSEGRRYVDLESGVWCTSIGHTHSRILRVLTVQSAWIGHTGFCYSNGIVQDAAQAILSLLGFEGGRCVFLCSGSEAVEYGVRVAQSLSDRPLLMTMIDSYFGAYGSASQKQKDEWSPSTGRRAPPVRFPGSAVGSASIGRPSPLTTSGDFSLSRAVLRGWSGFRRRS